MSSECPFCKKPITEGHIEEHLTYMKYSCGTKNCEKNFYTQTQLESHCQECKHEKSSEIKIDKYSEFICQMIKIDVKLFQILPIEEILNQRSDILQKGNGAVLEKYGDDNNLDTAGPQIPCELCKEEVGYDYFNRRDHVYRNHMMNFTETDVWQENVEKTMLQAFPYLPSCEYSCSSTTIGNKRKITESIPSLFECPTDGCDRKYQRRGNLTTHLRKVHDKIDPILQKTDVQSSNQAEEVVVEKVTVQPSTFSTDRMSSAANISIKVKKEPSFQNSEPHVDKTTIENNETYYDIKPTRVSLPRISKISRIVTVKHEVK